MIEQSKSNDTIKSGSDQSSNASMRLAHESYSSSSPKEKSDSGNSNDVTKILIPGSGVIEFGDHSALFGSSSKPFTAQSIEQAGNTDAQYLQDQHSTPAKSAGKDAGGLAKSIGNIFEGGGGGGNEAPNTAPPSDNPTPTPQAGQTDTPVSKSIAIGNMTSETSNQQESDEKQLRKLGAASGIDQGSTGDCGFESALAGFAHTKNGANEIANMISQNSDGSYTVTFPGDKAHPVTVTQSEIDADKVSNSSQWANVIEAAAIKHQKGNINPDLLELDQGNGTIIGIDGATAISLLTGTNTNTDQIFQGIDSSNATRIGQHINQSLADGGVVVAGTKGKDTGVESQHYYTVLGYDPKTNTVTLRNPWGENDGVSTLPGVGDTKGGVKNIGGGVVQMSMSDFMANFDELNYSGNPPSLVEQTGSTVSNTVHTILDLPQTLGSVF